eukprot:TRINITY_DN4055_c0_g1_i10.p1 TRINITY_DN4055_c0_g1~~TRINITY_DN4055_c0_g1_i10.p1  ORF type:complete len:751 (+),score=131.45 TRINITY_DN4055_c0_g1_i10:45-2297(+)
MSRSLSHTQTLPRGASPSKSTSMGHRSVWYHRSSDDDSFDAHDHRRMRVGASLVLDPLEICDDPSASLMNSSQLSLHTSLYSRTPLPSAAPPSVFLGSSEIERPFLRDASLSPNGTHSRSAVDERRSRRQNPSPQRRSMETSKFVNDAFWTTSVAIHSRPQSMNEQKRQIQEPSEFARAQPVMQSPAKDYLPIVHAAKSVESPLKSNTRQQRKIAFQENTIIVTHEQQQQQQQDIPTEELLASNAHVQSENVSSVRRDPSTRSDLYPEKSKHESNSAQETIQSAAEGFAINLDHKKIKPESAHAPPTSAINHSVRSLKSSTTRSTSRARISATIAMARSNDLNQQAQSLPVLVVLSEQVEMHETLVRSGLVPVLIKLYESNQQKIALDATTLLLRLCSIDATIDTLVQYKCIGILVASFDQHLDTDKRKLALTAINRVVLERNLGLAFMDAGGAEALIAHLKSKSCDCKAAVLKLLVELSKSSCGNKFILRRVACTYPGFLKLKDTPLRNALCESVYHLVESGSNLSFFMEQSKACQLHLSVLEVLEESLKCHNDETTVNALKAVGSFCQDDECVRVFLSHKIHECFIKLLRHKQVELQVSSIYVMSLMSSRDQYCKVLDQDVGSFQAIVILGMHSKPEIRYYIAVILLNLANNGYIRLLMQSDSVSLLVNLSRISDPKTQQTAALTLGKIMLLENMPAQDELSNFGLLLERSKHHDCPSYTFVRSKLFKQRMYSYHTHVQRIQSNSLRF